MCLGSGKVFGFNGHTKIPLTNWLEEVKTSMRVHHFPFEARFWYDHFEGKAREKMKLRPREDPEC